MIIAIVILATALAIFIYLFITSMIACNEVIDRYAKEVVENKELVQINKNLRQKLDCVNKEKTIMNISIKKLYSDAKIPTHGSAQSAGYDLYACISAPITIYPHTTSMIGTGLSIAVPEGYFGAIFARSGLATKQGLRPANCVGICDSDYRGEYIVAVHNDTDKIQVIDPGERIAQLVIMPYLPVEFIEVDELDKTERGNGGFGSTGK